MPILVTTPKFDCENMPSRYGPEAVFEELPGVVARQAAHAGAHDLAARQHHLPFHIAS